MGLRNFSTMTMLRSEQQTTKSFIKGLDKNKTTIWHVDDTSGRGKELIHGLALQLIASGIVRLDVSNRTKIGSDKLMNEHLVVVLTTGVDEGGMQMPTHFLGTAFDDMNI